MYTWYVILSRSGSAEYEILRPEGSTGEFLSKRNAQLFAERYVLDYVINADGIGRIEPCLNLSTPSSPLKGIVFDSSMTMISQNSHWKGQPRPRSKLDQLCRFRFNVSIGRTGNGAASRLGRSLR